MKKADLVNLVTVVKVERGLEVAAVAMVAWAKVVATVGGMEAAAVAAASVMVLVMMMMMVVVAVIDLGAKFA